MGSSSPNRREVAVTVKRWLSLRRGSRRTASCRRRRVERAKEEDCEEEDDFDGFVGLGVVLLSDSELFD